MKCKFCANIECNGGQSCDKCGWNPDVTENRKKTIAEIKDDKYGLKSRLSVYREIIINAAFEELAEEIGGAVNGGMLRAISDGVIPYIHPNELKRIDKELRSLNV